MSEELIMKVISLIKQVEISERDKSGIEKKEKLLTILKAITSPEDVEKNIDIINYIIETVIILSKLHMIAGINKTTCMGCIPKMGFR
jgi:hypothetical protein